MSVDKTAMSFVSTINGITRLVQANPNRKAILLTFTIGGTIFITDIPGATGNKGLPIAVNSNPLLLHERDVGDWVQKELFVIASAGSQTVGVLEVICTCRNPQVYP